MASQLVPGSGLPEPPLISVVVPVYGIGDYLPECLNSLLGRPAEPQPAGPAIEVIAVDDASPDGSGRILDARAGLDPRLTVVHLARNAGPGNARNIGLARATGRYVWFVDGDDVLPVGALAAVSARLVRDRPDVLLIDYEERYPGGQIKPSPGGTLLRAAPAGTFSLADAPHLINLTMTSWSKLFRRDFLLGLDEPFRPGIHEDIPVTCAALLAGRIGALDRVSYCYRRSRPGSFMATTSSEHWGVFGAYEEVLDRLRKLADSADPVATVAVQSALFERAIWHYGAVLEAGRLVPRADRARFFERMHADFLQYRPGGYRMPRGARGIKFRLIERGAYQTYELLEPVNRIRVAAGRRLRRR
jgi:glycosyltransferase involved in cell wall biosynthesis